MYNISVIVDVVLITHPFSCDISGFEMLIRLYECNTINLSTFLCFIKNGYLFSGEVEDIHK